VPNGPGLGVEIDERIIEKISVRPRPVVVFQN